MKRNNLPEYPRVALADLARLKLDAEAARRFERRSLPGLLGGLGLAFGGASATIALRHFDLLQEGVSAAAFIASFVLGVALLLWTHHRMMRAQPKSPQSGREMAAFIIADSEASGEYEIAYVDEPSGTYFRRRYVEPG